MNIAPLLRGMWELVDEREARIAELESEVEHLEASRDELIAQLERSLCGRD